MRLRYELRLKDVVAFAEYFNATLPARNRGIRVIQVAGALLTFLLMFDLFYFGLGGDDKIIGAIIGAAGSAIIFALLIPRSLRDGMKKQTRENFRRLLPKGYLGPHELVIGDDGLSDHTEFTHSTTKWIGIERVETTEEHAFVYTGTYVGYIIPFETVNEGDVMAFVRELAGRIGGKQQSN